MPEKKKRTPRQWRAIKRRQRFPDEQKKLRCSVCKEGRMILRESKLYGHWFYGCTMYPDCNHAHAASKTGKPLPGVDGRPKPTKPKPALPDAKPCQCGGNLILKFSHRRQQWFYGCNRYPQCWRCADATKPTSLWDHLKDPTPEAKPSKQKQKPKKKGRRGIWAVVQDEFLS